MAPREPTRAQLSSKLAYQANIPSFLQKLQNRMNGIPDEEEEEDEEFEHVGGGREPIPRRPAIPERPKEDPGSADEDFADEKPQVVVLKEGKHLTEREAENIKRAVHSDVIEKGLPPLPEASKSADQPTDTTGAPSKEESSSSSKLGSQGLSFSSSSKSTTSKSNKRKAGSQLDELKSSIDEKAKGKGTKHSKKAKKESKTLLSFSDDT